MVGQQAHVFDAFAQRGNVKGNHIQAVEQIFAEIAALDFFFEILVGGGDNADVHFNGFGGADGFKALLIQRAQQFGLGLERHVADFVEKERATIGLLQLADFVVERAGEAAFAVAEQFAFDQLFGDGGAVHFDKGFVSTRAGGVDSVGDQFLPSAAFAEDQHAAIGGGHQAQAAGAGLSWERCRR